MNLKRRYVIVGMVMCLLLPLTAGVTVREARNAKLQNAGWITTFGGFGMDYANSVHQTADGGYIVAGTTHSRYVGMGDIWVIKTDAQGNMVWDSIFGGREDDQGTSIQQTADGGYIIAGTTASFGVGGSDIWLIKTDAGGNMKWTMLFGEEKEDVVSLVRQTTDGGYIVAGSTKSFGAGDYDIWLIKTDRNGTRMWDKTFGSSDVDFCECMEQTADGGYILTGYTFSEGYDHPTMWLIKTDENGTMMWNTTFGGKWRSGIGHCVQQTADGGYIVAGGTGVYGGGKNLDVWLVKTDAYGNMVWHTAFGGISEDFGWCVAQTTDSGYILSGYTGIGTGFNMGMGILTRPWLVKTDANGTMEWERKIGLGTGIARSVAQTTDGGYIIGGHTGTLWKPKNVLLVKTDSHGDSLCGWNSMNISGTSLFAFGRKNWVYPIVFTV